MGTLIRSAFFTTLFFVFLVFICSAGLVLGTDREFGHPLFRTFTAHDYGEAGQIFAVTEDSDGRTFMSLIAGSMYASTEEQQIVDAVSGVFAALSAEDSAKFDSVTSQDFYLFEGGARFNKDAMMGMIKTLHAAGKRYEWNVTDPDVHIDGNTAWIAYTNKGSITDGSGTAKQNWLESAFLEKQADNWRIVFMHSTRVPMKSGTKE